MYNIHAMKEYTYTSSAAAKVILCGEHAVVYGYPAIAVPVSGVRVHATLICTSSPILRVRLPDLGEEWDWPPGPSGHPLALLIGETLTHLGLPHLGGRLTLRSDIPVGGGMGSSAAVAVAVVRVLAQAAGHPLPPEDVSALAYKAEVLWHGTPSGIDNTVIAHERPVWFIKGQPPHPFTPARGFTLVIGDSGISASTRDVVLAVRRQWEQDQERYNRIFQEIGRVVHAVRAALEAGDIEQVGPLLDENQRLLEEMGVSHPVLESLINAARRAGAWGAKLAGAGWGGNVIALVPPERATSVEDALRAAGATRTFITRVQGASDHESREYP